MYDCVKVNDDEVRIFNEDSNFDMTLKLEDIRFHFKHTVENIKSIKQKDESFKDEIDRYFSVEIELGRQRPYDLPRVEKIHNYLDKLDSDVNGDCISIKFEDKDDRDAFYEKFLRYVEGE